MDNFKTRCRECFSFLPLPKNFQVLKIKVINKSDNELPRYETSGSAGMDLRAFMDESVTLKPLDRALIPTGLHIELPPGYEAQIRPRSGLAAKRGLSLLNTPGTIDSDYRGEIRCILVNISNETQIIEPGERIAQMVIAKYEQAQWELTDSLSDTDRGEGGFGSTGRQ